jgi:hypothetical protein
MRQTGQQDHKATMFFASCRVLFSMLLISSIEAAVPNEAEAQEWSVQRSSAPRRWQTCRLVSPKFSGPCRVTFITQGSSSMNLHFDLDESGTQGLSFVIPIDGQERGDQRVFMAVAQRFQGNDVAEVLGICSIHEDSIRCINSDGTFGAQAYRPLP